MSSKPSIWIDKHEDHTVVTLSGTADMHSAPELEVRFTEVLEQKPKLLCIDLSGVSYMNSLTIGTFMKAYQMLKPAGGRVCIINPSPYALGVMKASKSDMVLRSFPTVEAARA